MAYPANYLYTKEHEWIEIDGENGTIGITDYAQSSLGDIVFVELPKVGDKLTAGSTFGTVESVKAVSDLYAPASGTITEINGELEAKPELINADANHTWLLRIKLSNPAEAASLLSSEAYEEFVSEETDH